VTADPLDPLRLALGVSPDNLPLRRHLADSLLNASCEWVPVPRSG
jgi:hypothetical protein